MPIEEVLPDLAASPAPTLPLDVLAPPLGVAVLTATIDEEWPGVARPVTGQAPQPGGEPAPTSSTVESMVMAEEQSGAPAAAAAAMQPAQPSTGHQAQWYVVNSTESVCTATGLPTASDMEVEELPSVGEPPAEVEEPPTAEVMEQPSHGASTGQPSRVPFPWPSSPYSESH